MRDPPMLPFMGKRDWAAFAAALVIMGLLGAFVLRNDHHQETPVQGGGVASKDGALISRAVAIARAKREVDQDLDATAIKLVQSAPKGLSQGEPVWTVSFENGYCETIFGPPNLKPVDPPGPCDKGTVPATAHVFVNAVTGEVLALASKGH